MSFYKLRELKNFFENKFTSVDMPYRR